MTMCSNRCRAKPIPTPSFCALYIAGQTLAVPTLVRRVPVPVRKIIGDLSNTQRVLAGLDVNVAAA
jgi:hypothetical protein